MASNRLILVITLRCHKIHIVTLISFWICLLFLLMMYKMMLLFMTYRSHNRHVKPIVSLRQIVNTTMFITLIQTISLTQQIHILMMWLTQFYRHILIILILPSKLTISPWYYYKPKVEFIKAPPIILTYYVIFNKSNHTILKDLDQE